MRIHNVSICIHPSGFSKSCDRAGLGDLRDGLLNDVAQIVIQIGKASDPTIVTFLNTSLVL